MDCDLTRFLLAFPLLGSSLVRDRNTDLWTFALRCSRPDDDDGSAAIIVVMSGTKIDHNFNNAVEMILNFEITNPPSFFSHLSSYRECFRKHGDDVAAF